MSISDGDHDGWKQVLLPESKSTTICSFGARFMARYEERGGGGGGCCRILAQNEERGGGGGGGGAVGFWPDTKGGGGGSMIAYRGARDIVQ